MNRSIPVTLVAALSLASAAQAAEKITYTYDAKGRLVKVGHSCPAGATSCVNNGVQTQYTHDKADNRKSVTTTGVPG